MYRRSGFGGHHFHHSRARGSQERSILMQNARPEIQVRPNLHYSVNSSYGEQMGVVSRHTRNFNKKLRSIGSSSSREDIELNPTSTVLQRLYNEIKYQIQQQRRPTTRDILAVVVAKSRACFPNTDIDAYVANQLRFRSDKVISLDSFIQLKKGVCRHHALLCAYVLSRLVEDNILCGEVIHHRNNLSNRAAHTWNVFICKAEGQGKIFSVDAQWNVIICVSDITGELPHYPAGTKRTLLQRYFPEQLSVAMPRINSYQGRDVTTLFSSLEEEKSKLPNKLQGIKVQIETTQFVVGRFLIFDGGMLIQLETGNQKRVPHRVADIYQLLLRNKQQKLTDEFCWNKIQTIVREALEAPRLKRHPKTTDFYQSIIEKTPSKQNNQAICIAWGPFGQAVNIASMRDQRDQRGQTPRIS